MAVFPGAGKARLLGHRTCAYKAGHATSALRYSRISLSRGTPVSAGGGDRCQGPASRATLEDDGSNTPHYGLRAGSTMHKQECQASSPKKEGYDTDSAGQTSPGRAVLLPLRTVVDGLDETEKDVRWGLVEQRMMG